METFKIVIKEMNYTELEKARNKTLNCKKIEG